MNKQRGFQDNHSELSTDSLIDLDPEILGGTPVFAGTRVPVRVLLEHLEAGDRLEDFLLDFPSVSREKVLAVLKCAVAELIRNSN